MTLFVCCWYLDVRWLSHQECKGSGILPHQTLSYHSIRDAAEDTKPMGQRQRTSLFMARQEACASCFRQRLLWFPKLHRGAAPAVNAHSPKNPELRGSNHLIFAAEGDIIFTTLDKKANLPSALEEEIYSIFLRWLTNILEEIVQNNSNNK